MAPPLGSQTLAGVVVAAAGVAAAEAVGDGWRKRGCLWPCWSEAGVAGTAAAAAAAGVVVAAVAVVAQLVAEAVVGPEH